MQAAIFDLDGTLVDSLEDIACALDRALDDHGIARPTRARVREWIGGGARNLIAQAVPEEMVEPVLCRFGVHYADAPCVHTRLYAGIEGVLDRFAEAGVKLAVCSNKPDALTKRIGAVVLARWPFGAIIGQRPHVALKPSPDAAVEVAQLLDVVPEACTFVGDSAIDILTAHAAKMRPVGVSWGFRPRTELAAANASLIADAPADLLTLLESRASRAVP